MNQNFLASLLVLAVAVFAPDTSVAGPFSGVDTDGDGIDNVLDNCTSASNLNQVDADGDGCGNRCDGDYDNTGLASIGDFTTFKTCFTRTVGAPGGPATDPTCVESDMDGSGAMSIGDFTDFKIEFTSGGGLPGPSGSPIKAGAPSCP